MQARVLLLVAEEQTEAMVAHLDTEVLDENMTRKVATAEVVGLEGEAAPKHNRRISPLRTALQLVGQKTVQRLHDDRPRSRALEAV